MLFFYFGLFNVLILGMNIAFILDFADGCISWVTSVLNIVTALACFARFFATYGG